MVISVETYVSILNCDILNLEREIERLVSYDVCGIHIDIMDGSFVEDVTYGWVVVDSIVKSTNLIKPVEVHLMVNSPERHLLKYIQAKPDRIIIHPESTYYLRKNLLSIRNNDIKAAVALKLETPIELIENTIDLIDSVLLITCDEGFGGNEFQDISLQKIKKLNQIKKENNLTFEISVDGGINDVVAQKLANVGVQRLISGSYILRGGEAAVKNLKNL